MLNFGCHLDPQYRRKPTEKRACVLRLLKVALSLTLSMGKPQLWSSTSQTIAPRSRERDLTGSVPGEVCYGRSNWHIPRPGHSRANPQIQLGRKPAEHSYHCARLRHSPGQHAQKKNAKQRPIRDGSDLESDFNHPSHPAEADHSQGKKHHRPNHSRKTREPDAAVFIGFRVQSQIEVQNGTRGERIQSGT